MMFMAILMVMTITANAMSYNAAKNEALFLSDKMAYELDLTAAQYEAVYEINLDYLMGLNGHSDVFGIWWDRRNADLRYVLTSWQYDKYMSCAYFYRPVAWNRGTWTFNIYSHYTGKSHFYKGHPKGYVSYKGGNNKKPANHYASMKPKNNRSNHGNGSTWRNTNRGNNDRHIAQNNSRGNGSCHFGRR